MLYPSCPNCGSRNVESFEPDTLEYGQRHLTHWLQAQALAGHPHPWVKAAGVSVSMGRAIYKRIPGGGTKRCTDCRHVFR